jgi:hypothetical protein
MISIALELNQQSIDFNPFKFFENFYKWSDLLQFEV